MKNFIEGAEETKPKISQKKDRRSRKPKFELCKPRKVTNYKKKKDNKRKQIDATQIAEFGLIKFAEIRAKNQQHKELISKIELGMERFRLRLAEVRASNQQLKEFFSEIDGYILAKLASWDDEDK